jgi:hypothetical protein
MNTRKIGVFLLLNRCFFFGVLLPYNPNLYANKIYFFRVTGMSRITFSKSNSKTKNL